MNIIAMKRGEGKTTELIKISHETGYPIVSINPYYVIILSRDLGIDIPKPIHATTLKFKAKDMFAGSTIRSILLDDAEYVKWFEISNGECKCKFLDDLHIEVHTITVSIGDNHGY